MTWTFSKKLLFIGYKFTASWLPISHHLRFAKYLRVWWARRICRSVGKDVNIERGAIFSPEVSIGDYSGINCELYGPVNIGKYVMMGPEVVIYTDRHIHTRTDIPMQQQGIEPTRPVFIGDDCWIGRRVIILSGIHIGKGCIIGAGAVVTKDIPDFSVAGGVPARIIKQRKNI